MKVLRTDDKYHYEHTCEACGSLISISIKEVKQLSPLKCPVCGYNLHVTDSDKVYDTKEKYITEQKC